ncbi:S-layer homology domain-containing protein [Cohnella abietis]|uniref:SLH domain-containing protein n=1 Tax=Cohnella abietis TaxID=2507935 RepID=A0A3T1DBR6_9BACL|nr:S-layer homology domain-containing protein [Cohnella abietis]BBI35542.1 hypothetical protein KCTCHS21_49410 [Cohnella abietis]
MGEKSSKFLSTKRKLLSGMLAIVLLSSPVFGHLVPKAFAASGILTFSGVNEANGGLILTDGMNYNSGDVKADDILGISLKIYNVKRGDVNKEDSISLRMGSFAYRTDWLPSAGNQSGVAPIDATSGSGIVDGGVDVMIIKSDNGEAFSFKSIFMMNPDEARLVKFEGFLNAESKGSVILSINGDTYMETFTQSNGLTASYFQNVDEVRLTNQTGGDMNYGINIAFNNIEISDPVITVTPPAAPSVSADDVTNTIIGLTTAMEFKVDDGAYTKYTGTNAPDLSGTRTVKVRVAAGTGTPAGAETTLSFTPNPPAAPSVSADDVTNTITGLTTAMEFQVDGGTYTRYTGTNAPNLSGTHTVKVRVAAVAGTGTPAGAETTLNFTPNPPAAPSVSADDVTNTITGLTTAMEFQVDGGTYERYTGTNAPNLSGTHTVKVRVAADPGTGTPAGAETTLSFTPNPPAAPSVSADDVTNTITGLTTAMEFQVDGGTYERYTGTNAPNLSGTHTVKVRVAADSGTGTPAGAETTLNFTPNPPAAPSVSADDVTNTITGLTTAMEFQVDGGTYVKYNGTNAPNLSGTHTVKVRVAADAGTGTPAGAETTLSFTPNPPAAPSVSADDVTNTITGLTTAMEFQLDGGTYVKYNGTNAPNLSGTHTVKVRVAADAGTGTPAGAETTLNFTPNPPAAPSVSADDVANTITALTTAMEFQVDGGTYVKYNGTNAPNLSGTHTVKVRVAADPGTGTPAGAETTLSFTPNPPAAPSVSADDVTNTITGLTTAMEFQVDGGTYVKYNGTNAPNLSGTHTVKVRVAADAGTGTPAGAETTLSFTPNPPAAPSVSADDVTNTITGLTTAMEFQLDGGTYVKYNGTNAPNLSGTHTVKVRVAADAGTGTPAGAETTLNFTPNPPAAPSVSADDVANTITGLTTAMEFQVDGGTYVKYNGTNAPNLSGTHTVKVRVAADPGTGTPAGAETTLSFTPNPPAAPSVSADDVTNTITGLTTAMEFQVDGGAYTRYTGTNAPNLSGTHTVKVRVAADPGTGTPAGAETTLSFITNPSAPSTSTPSAPEDITVNVLVNGKVVNAGNATASTRNNQKVINILVDEKKLDQRLTAEGQKAVITIPIDTKVDVVVGELNGRMIQSMEQKQAVIEIKSDKATYTIPAQQINISSISEQLGKAIGLQDIKIQIEIASPTLNTVNLVESSAQKGDFSIVVPSIDFIVRAVYGDKRIDVTKFEAYVERTIAIPDGVDPNKITTGIVVEPDGMVRHVPTKIVVIGTEYYAKVNSLTNSTYSIVYNPIAFDDVAQHWAKTEVNDMGSRMVINGIGNDLFNPNQAITRAEFAAVMVRGLGLKLVNGVTSFSDVKTTDWFSGAVQTLYEYKLINGFEDGTFRPTDTITREQAMKIISQAMVLTDLKSKLSVKETADLLKPFADGNKVAEWAKASIAEVIQSGIITGRSSSTLAPKANISRAEVAVIIRRLLQNSELI